MSTSWKGRKIKLTNPEEQLQIRQFIVDIGQSPTTPTSTDSALTPTISTHNKLKGKNSPIKG